MISWVAVTQYLHQEAITDTLTSLVASQAGTELVLTYVVPPDGLTEMGGAREQCSVIVTSEAVHLDPGAAADRVPANRLNMRHKVRISAHHFERNL
jgi:hypothetical protein